MKTIKVRNAKIDNMTPVVAMDELGIVCFHLYGELQEGAYILLSDMKDALKSHKPRTTEDILRYIEKNGIEWIEQVDIDGDFDCFEVFKGQGQWIEWHDNSDGWITDMVNYLMDMEEGV